MSEKEEAMTRYRLKVLRYEPAAMVDTFEGGVSAQYDAVVFQILEGGSGEITVYFPQSDAAQADRFEKGAVMIGTTSEPDLLSNDVIFSGALEFEK